MRMFDRANERALEKVTKPPSSTMFFYILMYFSSKYKIRKGKGKDSCVREFFLKIENHLVAGAQ